MRSSAGSTRQVFNCWQPAGLSQLLVPTSQGLERAARGDISTVTDDFLSTSKNLAFHTVVYADII